MIRINPNRVLSNLRQLATFGAYKTGVHRPTLSDEDIAAREWFAGKMREAGLNAEIDGIGNILGLSPHDGPKVLAGSHLESQRHAGWLDGALGCVYALETATALAQLALPAGVDVAVFCDEEGHFGSFLGSKSFLGLIEESEIDSATDRVSGTRMRERLQKAGWSGRPRHVIVPDRYSAFFEAHIEQGTLLEEAGARIGVVTAIVGNWQYRITALGEQNHAGTTSMKRRRDAGRELIQLLSAIDRRFETAAGSRTVWTFGRVEFEPGERGIIPGKALSLLQFRDIDVDVLERMDEILREEIGRASKAGRCTFEFQRSSASMPVAMDSSLQAVIARAAERRAAGQVISLPSGAVHDAQWMAKALPSAMMFIPSIGGISHHWTENTSDDDIVLGAQVFADAIAEML